ncbi:MAG: hypothetical protein ACOC1K_02390 [Nanoarchaeota archaeon]
MNNFYKIYYSPEQMYLSLDKHLFLSKKPYSFSEDIIDVIFNREEGDEEEEIVIETSEIEVEGKYIKFKDLEFIKI